jgi:hypothetical protein
MQLSKQVAAAKGGVKNSTSFVRCQLEPLKPYSRSTTATTTTERVQQSPTNAETRTRTFQNKNTEFAPLVAEIVVIWNGNLQVEETKLGQTLMGLAANTNTK